MNKKKIIPVIAVLVLLGGKNLWAQDCRAIVLPMCNYNEEEYAKIPEDKLAIHCAYARNMFYVADEWKKGAPIYSISEVKENRSGNFMARNVKINLDSLSYYAYDFVRFQARHNGKEIYFETPGSEHPYLVLRTAREARNREMNPQEYEN